MPLLGSVPAVLDATLLRGGAAAPDAPPDLLIEIPHGATTRADYDALAARLEGPLPPDLVEFFFVNTDVGAPELGLALGRALVDRAPARTVALLRSRIPRTFIDCNRVVDPAAAEGPMTPGLMPWIVSEPDRMLLLERHRAYVAAVREAAGHVIRRGGAMLLLHTYAPRSVDVKVEADIVERLRAAYAPDVVERWPLRPALDVIHRLEDGTSTAPGGFVERLGRRLEPLGLAVGDGETYALHPSTVGHGFATAWPGRVVCIEVRRDLLADPYVPLAEVHISPAKVQRLADPLAEVMAGLLDG